MRCDGEGGRRLCEGFDMDGSYGTYQLREKVSRYPECALDPFLYVLILYLLISTSRLSLLYP